MALVALTSVKGAPGVTTTALALLFAWPRPALLVEADTAAGSSILAGYLRGSIDHTHGLLNLILAHRQEALDLDATWAQTVQLAEGRHLLPGLGDPGQAAGMTATWSKLAETLRAVEAQGVDVLIDAGRVGTAYAPALLLRQADTVAVLTGTRLPDVYALTRRLPALKSDLAAHSSADAAGLITVGEGRPYSNAEIAKQTQTPVIAGIAHDPAAADVYSIGAPAGRRFTSSQLARTSAVAAQALIEFGRRRLEYLAGPLAPPSSQPAQSTQPGGWTNG
jgi:hypothetical protein